MLELDYLEELTIVTPEPTLSLLLNIESNLNKLQYEDHMELIDDVINSSLELTTSELSTDIQSVYQITIATILSKQGIELQETIEDNIYKLSELFSAVTVLGTTDISDLLIETSNDNDDSVVYMSEIISEVSDLRVDEVLGMLSDVDPKTVGMLQLYDPVNALSNYNADVSRSRYLSAFPPDERVGLVADLVKQLGTFAISIDTLISTLGESLSELPLDRVVVEFKALMLVSDVSTVELHTTASTLLENIVMDTGKVLTILNRLNFNE